MRKRTLAVAFALALLAAPAALAGGFATVGLSSLPEDGLAAGKTWQVDLTILQHGVTPVQNATPRVRIRDGEGTVQTFSAQPTAETGVYRAHVVFPSSGRWNYEVLDGFVDVVHTYPPVQIGAQEAAAPASAQRPDDAGPGVGWMVGGAAAVLAAAAAALVALSRRRAGPAPA